MKNPGILLGFLLLLIASATYSHAETNTELNTKPSINIGINPMIELDFLTKEDIYDIRSKYVLLHPELLPGSYNPSEEVFGQIASGKPWWGILGLSYYGDGEKSIEGNSEESRFLVNPFLLVGLDEGEGVRVDNPKLKPIEIYPKPISLEWSADKTFAKVLYDVSEFWRNDRIYQCPVRDKQELGLVTYNARDLGFNYLYVVHEKSKNISKRFSNREAILLKHALHCGGSCGYPGGCNNASPRHDELYITIVKLPALAYLKLWGEKPKSVDNSPDMVFVIEMI